MAIKRSLSRDYRTGYRTLILNSPPLFAKATEYCGGWSWHISRALDTPDERGNNWSFLASGSYDQEVGRKPPLAVVERYLRAQLRQVRKEAA